MEYNTLNLHIELTLEEAGAFINSLLQNLSDIGIRMPSIIDWDFDLKKIFENDKESVIFNTEFFKDNRFEYEVRFHLTSLRINESFKKPKSKWFEFFILFKTSHLAKDKENDDFFMSDFEYSEKSKKVILDLSEKLHNVFPKSYISFANEYNDTEVCEFLTNENCRENNCSDYELAIVPKTKLGDLFSTNGKTIEKDNYRILLNHRFIIE